MNNQNDTSLLYTFHETLYVDFDTPSSLTFLKGNQSAEVYVVFSQSDINANSQEMLEKMMTACKLSDSQYAFIALDQGQTPQHVYNAYQPHIMLLFNFKLSNDHYYIDRPLHRPFNIADMKVLYSHRLADIIANTQLKLDLWNNGLKPLFSI